MSYADRDAVPFADLRVTGALVALLLASVAILFLKPGFANSYAGYGALVAIPLCIGALFTEAWGRYSWLGCLGTPVLLFAASLGLVALGAEGFVCVAMVMPAWIAAALGGGLMSIWLARADRPATDSGGVDPTTLRASGLLVLPFVVIFAEHAAPPRWERREVVRSVVIDAPPEVIWPLLVSIPRIAGNEGRSTFTHDWARVPRPSAAKLLRRDGALVRVANWGRSIRFEERVDSIAPGRRLGWHFAFPDNSVQLHTDRHIDPDGPVLKIESGRYDVTPLGQGRTRLTLSTRYRMRSRLGWYFGLWGERFLGDIGSNVLAIVHDRAAA